MNIIQSIRRLVTAGAATTLLLVSAAAHALPPPAPTSVLPSSGTFLGGATVRIYGTDVELATSVTFGPVATGLPASILATGTGYVVVRVPGGVATTSVDVNVTNANGTGTLSSAYAYVSSDTVTNDFSRDTNPQGRWTHGWSSNGTTFTPFTMFDATSTIEYWTLNNSYPRLWRNSTNSVQVMGANTIMYEGAMALHPGPGGEYAVVRWTAPASGQYSMSGFFKGLDAGPPVITASNAIIKKNGTVIWSSDVNYPSVYSFSMTAMSVVAGQTLDFMVGYGTGGSPTYSNDSTGFDVTITPISGSNVVTNTSDSAIEPPPGSLRYALNSMQMQSGCSTDTIYFNIPGTGPFTISPTTALPTITCDFITIDGYSQPGASANTQSGGTNDANIQIILNGSSCAGCSGLTISASQTKIKGLAIHSFAGPGIKVLGGSAFIEGNYIGTDPGGSSAYPNGTSAELNNNFGIRIEGGNVNIGKQGFVATRNLITGNAGGGVFVASPATYFTTLAGNHIRFNTGAGVEAALGGGPHLVANYIHGNGGTAFDIGSNGPTAPDFPDADGIPNRPTILSVTYAGGNTTIMAEARSSSNTQAGNTVRFDFFHNDSPPALPAGQLYMDPPATGSVNPDGIATVTVTIPGFVANVTATASYRACPTCDIRTSEYSYPLVTAPGAPTIGTATGGNAQATITFTPPASNGGSAITSYTATSNPGGFVSSGAGSPLTVTGLANGTPYTFTVTATNSVGTGPASGASNSVTPMAPATIPGPPTIGTATAGNAQATVTFSPPASDGGSPITSYKVTSSPGGIVASGGSSPIIVSGLTNGTAYTFSVSATTSVGTGPGSAPSNSVTPATVPGAPTIGTAAAGNSQATITFTPPASNGGSAITSYTVTSSPGGFVATGAGSPLTVTGLANGTPYTFTVTATNSVGSSPPSAASNSVTPMTVPAAPTIGSATVSGGQVMVSFTPPASNGGSPVTGYTVTSSPSGITATGGASPITITGLTNGTAYTFTVTATNAAGTGAASAPSNSVTLAASATLTPAPASFGSVVVGSTATLNVTLTNTGNASMALSGISVSGSFFTQANSCPTSLAPGASCSITVSYAPTATGPSSGQLSVQSNAASTPHVVALDGTGTAPGVSLTPSPIAFGSVPVGGNASATLNLANTGTATLSISSIVTSGTFFSNTTTCGATLAPGASCPIVVTYAPGAAGAHSGQVSVTTNAGAGPVVAPLSGTGAVPVLSLSSASVDFGSQTVGSASLTQPVTITNTGGAPLNLSAIAASGDFNFTGCPTPLSLAPGASCTLSIKFVPTAVGTRSGGISIGSNASGTPHAIALTGNGTPVPVPGIALAPGSASFGAIVTGTNSTQVLVLSNPGTAPLAISSIGTTGAGFSQANTCPASLAPSAACNISVTFAPTVEGAASGQLAIVSNAAPSPLNAALSGSGLPATTAGLTFSASNVAFPPQFVGTTSAPRTVTLTSSGTAPLAISQVTGSGDFAFSGCGPSTMAPAATCTFSITFRPQAIGPLTGSIVVTSNAAGSPHTLALSGNGASLTAPEIVIAPSAFAFGTLRTARTASLAGRLSNTGAAALQISQIQATGAFFTQTNNCPSTIPVGGFCDITVTYSPTATGAHSGQLAIRSNAIPSPHVTALSGTGITVPPPFLSTSAEVSFGQQVTGTTVRRTLVLTNTGGDPLVISSMAIVGSGAFGVEGGCGTIAPEGSCSLTLTFLATGINTFNARLDIVSNHSGGAVQVRLSGQGVALPQPDLDFSVGALGFGNQGLNTSAQPGRTVRLTNIGGAPVTISALRVTLPDFRIPAGACIGTMAPGAFCDIEVVFHPVAPGPRQGSLVVDSNPVQTDSVALIGVGCRQILLGRNQSPARLCSP